MLYVSPVAHQPAFRHGSGAESPEARQAALVELEHFFIFQLLKEMRKSVPHEGVLDGGHARPVFDEMLDDALSGAMAQSGQFGIADQIEAQLHAADIARRVQPAGEAAPAQ